MAVLSTLVKAVAEIEGLEETQVAWVGRYLREAGLISQGGRGRGGASMTVVDAANLLIGINAAPSPKDAVSAVNRIRRLGLVDEAYPITDDLADENEISRALYRPLNAADCIQKLVECFVSIDLKGGGLIEQNSPKMYISFSRPVLRVSVRVDEGVETDEELPKLYALIEFSDPGRTSLELPDKSDRTTITQRTLAAIGRALSN